MKESLLFAAHGGSYRGSRAAIIMSDHALPIACSHWSYSEEGKQRNVAECGLHACWEACSDVEQFFEQLGIEAVRAGSGSDKRPEGWRPEGLYVYEVSYDEDQLDFDGDDWGYLAGGDLRRPTVEELEPLTQGLAPWGGVVL